MVWPDLSFRITGDCSPARLYSLVVWFVLTFSAPAGRDQASAPRNRTTKTAFRFIAGHSTSPVPNHHAEFCERPSLNAGTPRDNRV